ncbi:helix-turn-helix domain-containing protein [Streptomyces longispororuber]|uniref:helix-turn-helix domain-containing protein n=1 Tax=Streptomyces longispororuber TaxID=68230 RepID=UPI00210DE668|nr:helix-turn-helix transcriptional regulator [Streptomyces longispororuber]MCQ4207568.1 helix-turn-helix domain-containing protein [Streptomyces longispororuber]
MSEAIESATPALCRLQLGSELRRLRNEAGLKAAEVVRELAWAGSKLTRLETADNGIVEPSDVMALCQIYAAPAETTAILKGYATVTKTKRDWWQSPEYRDVIPPGLKAYLSLEATASSLNTYASEFVPGLLQTEEYIRTIHAADRLSQDDIDRLVKVRVTRQEVLHREHSPLRLTAVLNEAVLRRAVGGNQVMGNQLAHITEIATSLPNVKVQVVPFSAGHHPAMNGPFTSLQFRHPILKPIVYLENLANAGVSRREDDVDKYEETFRDLQVMAPAIPESLELIKNARKEFHR